MRRFARRLGTILVVIACGFLFSLLVQQVFPFKLRVGMPWREARWKLALAIHFPVFSGSLAGAPIDEETGQPEYHADLRHIQLPDGRCIEIFIRAPYKAGASRNEAEWSIAGLEVGPRFAGYGDKLKWHDYPKTYPQVLNLSWCSLPAIGAFVVGLVVAAVFVPRLMRRLGKGSSASS
jgi:hypothetical protein